MQVKDHTFHLDWPAGGLPIRLPEVAERMGWIPEVAHEDGLGEVRQCLFALPCGRMVLLRELARADGEPGRAGPDVVVEGADIVRLGPKAVMAEVMALLGLADATPAWVGPDEASQAVAAFLGS